MLQILMISLFIEICALYQFRSRGSSVSIVTKLRAGRPGLDMRNSYSILVGKYEAKRPLGRLGRRWEDVRMDLTEIGWEDVDWIHLA